MSEMSLHHCVSDIDTLWNKGDKGLIKDYVTHLSWLATIFY